MIYKLVITERADELLDKLVYYLLYELSNEQAALHLIREIEKLYIRIEDNPFQFPECRDTFLQYLGYHEAVIPGMKYLVIFKISQNKVYILGIFHELENYKEKF